VKGAQFRSLELLGLFWHPLQLREATRHNASLTIDRTSLRLVFEVVLAPPASTIMVSNLPQSLEVSSIFVIQLLIVVRFPDLLADSFENISLLVHDIVEYSYSGGGGIRL